MKIFHPCSEMPLLCLISLMFIYLLFSTLAHCNTDHDSWLSFLKLLFRHQSLKGTSSEIVCQIHRSASFILATRVLVVTLMTFIMRQQRIHTICNPKLIAIFPHLEKNLKGQSIARMLNYIISSDKGNSSDRGYNCEAKLSCEHF